MRSYSGRPRGGAFLRRRHCIGKDYPVHQSADILVVGGGVMGTSIALALAERKPGCVVVVEKSFLGAGSSGKSGAIIRQHYSNRLTAAMARRSLRAFERFDEIVGGPPVFTRAGMVIVVNDRDRAGLDANIAMQ